jgi:uncharacterized protein
LGDRFIEHVQFSPSKGSVGGNYNQPIGKATRNLPTRGNHLQYGQSENRSMANEPAQHTLAGLETVLRSQDGRRAAPVDRWNPPYCGDIGLEILRDGTWLYQKSPIGRRALVQLFARVLRKDDDGRTYLVTPAEKVDVKVHDAPFLAVEMEVRNPGPGQSLLFRTNVDDIVLCGPEHPLRFAREANGGLKPYLLVRGRLEALVTRALYQDLVALAEPLMVDDQTLGLWSNGVVFRLETPTSS